MLKGKLFLVGLMALGMLSACGKDEEKPNEQPANESASASVPVMEHKPVAVGRKTESVPMKKAQPTRPTHVEP